MNANHVYIKAMSYLIMFLFITIIIPLHLFPCFVSGFLAYETIISLTPCFERFFGSSNARWVIITLISTFVIVSIILCSISLFSFITASAQNGTDITNETNRIFSNIKSRMPDFFPSFLPESTEELKDQIFSLIESNLSVIRNMGHSFIHGIVTVFIGLIIGTIISLNKPSSKRTYFTQQLLESLYYLSQAFRNIVFAQVKVSLINTFLTAIIILFIFPLFNIYIPLKKSLILITFICGLIPIVGNLISNFMIIISALSVSLTVGSIMFFYLIFIHKLEYFLNAEIIGNRINAKPWELLLAMLFLESAFGLEGLIAAPIYYAYLKSELKAKGII